MQIYPDQQPFTTVVKTIKPPSFKYLLLMLHDCPLVMFHSISLHHGQQLQSSLFMPPNTILANIFVLSNTAVVCFIPSTRSQFILPEIPLDNTRSIFPNGEVERERNARESRKFLVSYFWKVMGTWMFLYWLILPHGSQL